MNSPVIPEIGVAEEFHIMDLATRSLVARAPELLRRLPGAFAAGLAVRAHGEVADMMEFPDEGHEILHTRNLDRMVMGMTRWFGDVLLSRRPDLASHGLGCAVDFPDGVSAPLPAGPASPGPSAPA